MNVPEGVGPSFLVNFFKGCCFEHQSYIILHSLFFVNGRKCAIDVLEVHSVFLPLFLVLLICFICFFLQTYNTVVCTCTHIICIYICVFICLLFYMLVQNKQSTIFQILSSSLMMTSIQ